MNLAQFDALRTLAVMLLAAVIVVTFVQSALATYLAGNAIRRLGSEEGVLIPSEGLALRSVVPDVEMTDLRTGMSFLPSELRGGPLLIAFLSGQCRPCRELVPHLNAVAAKAKDTHFVVIVDEGSGAGKLAELDRRIAVVEDGSDRRLGEAFKVRVAPLVYVMDADGLITIRAVPNTLLQLEDALDGSGHHQRAAWTTTQELS